MEELSLEPQSGQEQIKPLTTANAVTSDGIKVKPKEPVVIIGVDDKKKNPHLGTGEHTVHRILAEKLVKKGAATYKNEADKPKEAVKA